MFVQLDSRLQSVIGLPRVAVALYASLAFAFALGAALTGSSDRQL